MPADVTLERDDDDASVDPGEDVDPRHDQARVEVDHDAPIEHTIDDVRVGHRRAGVRFEWLHTSELAPGLLIIQGSTHGFVESQTAYRR
jgi:hypothetical protein